MTLGLLPLISDRKMRAQAYINVGDSFTSELIKSARTHTHRARARLQKRIESSYEMAVKLDPESVKVYNSYAYYLLKVKGRADLALALLDSKTIEPQSNPGPCDAGEVQFTAHFMVRGFQSREYEECRRLLLRGVCQLLTGQNTEGKDSIIAALGVRFSDALGSPPLGPLIMMRELKIGFTQTDVEELLALLRKFGNLSHRELQAISRLLQK